jgi:ribosomal protein L15
MQKVQRLQFAKNFLSNCKKGTLTHLAEHSFWRDSFKDQLEVSYKHHLVDLSCTNSSNSTLASSYFNTMVSDYAKVIADGKVTLKAEMETTRKSNKVKRLIESADRR